MVWLTTWDIARKAGVTPERVRQWVREGKLDCIRSTVRGGTGFRRLFREEDVEACLARRAERRRAA